VEAKQKRTMLSRDYDQHRHISTNRIKEKAQTVQRNRATLPIIRKCVMHVMTDTQSLQCIVLVSILFVFTPDL